MREHDHGLVIGKFYPFHAGHAHLIRQALLACRRVTVQVIGSSVESIPLEHRVAWVRAEHPTAHVVSTLDDQEVDFDSPTAWDGHLRTIRGLLDAEVDAVFTSDDYGAELARRLSARWVQVDPGRRLHPVSGRELRADLAGGWAMLPAPTRAGLVQRVVVLGAESTGSTTLAGDLATELGTHWVPEYGREHSLTRAGGPSAPWRSDEFDLIADRQIALETEAAHRVPGPLLVCDTDLLATVVWHERYVGAPAPALHARALAHPPALYLLTADDIPFVQDGTRDGEHLRAAMAERFRDVLADQPVPWIEVRGSRAERLARAVPAVRQAVARALTFADPIELRH